MRRFAVTVTVLNSALEAAATGGVCASATPCAAPIDVNAKATWRDNKDRLDFVMLELPSEKNVASVCAAGLESASVCNE